LFSKVIEFPILHLRDRIFPPEVVADVPVVVLQSESATLVSSRVDQTT
jgi:hypothetical protein